MEYVKSFVIGASPLVTFPFYAAVSQMPEKQFTLGDYCPIVPMYFGAMNVLSRVAGEYLGWSLEKRLFIWSFISALIVIIYISINESWAFETQGRWYLQYAAVLVTHMFTYMFTIYQLEKTF